MSYFDILLIRKIKSIYCYAMPTGELAGIFKNREISIDENIVSWFNANEGQYNDELHYLEFNNLTPNLLNYGKYIETIPGVKVKTQTGVLTLTENFNLFSINQPYLKGIHISLENEMYKDIKCTFTEDENKKRYENKIFKFAGVNEEGSVIYSTQVGEKLLLFFDHELHSWVLANTDAENFTGIETNDNSLFLLAVNDVSNAFNDYFRFEYLPKKTIFSNDYHKRNRRKKC